MVASQSKVLDTNEVFELPPYAEELIFDAASELTVSVSHDNVTFYALEDTRTSPISGTTDGNELYSITGPILQYIKFNGACTLYYKVSKR